MSALPCSKRRPWLANGFTPLGLVTSSSVFFSTPASRSTHSTRSPSFSNNPSSYATSSARPWNGAVVSKTSFLMAYLLMSSDLVTPSPVNHVGERSPVQICAQIVGEHLDDPMLRHIGTTGDMRRNQHALVLPETAIGGVLELPEVDVQTDATQLPRRQRGDQRLFVDDLPAGDVDQHRSRTHGRKRLATNQPGRFRCPLTTDGHEVTLPQQRMEMRGTFETAESREQV